MSRMFDIVTKTWNPVVGCEYACIYCWARQLAIKRRLYPQGFKPQFFPERLKRVPRKGFIFVGDMADMFGDFIPSDWIEMVLKAIRKSGSKATFLFLTRNPRRYREFEDLYTDNMILGVTLETNVKYEVLYDIHFWDYLKIPRIYSRKVLKSMPHKISMSPEPPSRLVEYREAMEKIGHARRFVSIEPILLFDLTFPMEIGYVDPEIIYVGYDNYRWKLPEPPLKHTKTLIQILEGMGYPVLLKTIRKAWWEVDGGA